MDTVSELPVRADILAEFTAFVTVSPRADGLTVRVRLAGVCDVTLAERWLRADPPHRKVLEEAEHARVLGVTWGPRRAPRRLRARRGERAKPTQADVADIRRLRREGKSYRQIEKVLGIGRETVRAIARRP